MRPGHRLRIPELVRGTNQEDEDREEDHSFGVILLGHLFERQVLLGPEIEGRD